MTNSVNQNSTYSDLARALAEIARIDAARPRQQQGGMGGIYQNGLEQMAKMWDYYGGKNLADNTFGAAPQILNNDRNLAWMNNALQGHGEIGGFSGHAMTTGDHATFVPDQMTNQQMAAAKNPYTGYINSNTGLPNGYSSVTGMPVPPPPPGQVSGIGTQPVSPLGGSSNFSGFSPSQFQTAYGAAQAAGQPPSSYFNVANPDHADMINTVFANAGINGGAADLFS